MKSSSTKASGDKGGYVLAIALTLLCILPITTLFQPYALFGNVNKAIVFLVLICLFLSFFKMRFHPAYWLSLLALMGLTGYDYLISSGEYATSNDPIYLLFWFLLMMVFTEGSQEIEAFIESHVSLIRWVMGIWTLLVGVSIFMPSSYGSAWGDGTYFGSIPHSIFRLAPCACLIQVFLLIMLGFDRQRKYLYLICQFVPLYCGFMGGSRTYFAVIALYFLLFLYLYADSKEQFHSYLFIALFMGAIAFGFSGIGSKVAATQYTDSSYFDFWGTVTNGRSDIWASDLEYYFNTDVVSALFGSGYDKVYELSLASRLGAAVYAHNDFLNVLVVNGALGFALYVVPVIALLRRYRIDEGASLSLALVVVAIWVGNAMFNMNYTYTCAAIALVFLPYALAYASLASAGVGRAVAKSFPLEMKLRKD